MAAIAELRANPPKQWTRARAALAAVGFSFGGTTVLELARDGAALAGVVCLHGSLDTPPRHPPRRVT